MNSSNDQCDVKTNTPEVVMGEPPIWFVNSLDAIAPGFARLIVETEFGTSYKRSGLDTKTRQLVLIASCAALGTTGIDSVRKHIPAALNAGATRIEILEVLVQIGFAAGLAVSFGALQAAAEVFAESDAREAR